MKYCNHCGQQIDDNAAVCVKCGFSQDGGTVNTQNNDSGSFGWAVLGFFVPLVGLILFCVWKNTKPKCSKKAGIGALVGFILGILCNVLLSVMSTAFLY